MAGQIVPHHDGAVDETPLRDPGTRGEAASRRVKVVREKTVYKYRDNEMHEVWGADKVVHLRNWAKDLGDRAALRLRGGPWTELTTGPRREMRVKKSSVDCPEQGVRQARP